jgi:predicted TIM-barrel fold metal-dependent hydrolase
MKQLADAHRHVGTLPAYAFYGGPAVNPDVTARSTVDALLADLDSEGTERALVIPNYGVPDVAVTFALNDLVVEAASRDDRVRAGIYVSPRPQDLALTEKALTLANEPGVRALKTTFLLGGRADDEQCRPALDLIFASARDNNLVVHVHTSPGAASDIDVVGHLVEDYGDDVKIHLVHLGGGMSGHIKLIGGRFFDWIAAGKQVYTDTSWAIGFAPRWLAAEIDKRGLGADRVLFASDEPWGDHAGELARLQAAVGDGELARSMFTANFAALYD